MRIYKLEAVTTTYHTTIDSARKAVPADAKIIQPMNESSGETEIYSLVDTRGFFEPRTIVIGWIDTQD
jgi:hypothetical protein